MPRSASIFAAYRDRLDQANGSQATYLGTPDAVRAVWTALEGLPAGREIAARVQAHEVFDQASASSSRRNQNRHRRHFVDLATTSTIGSR